MSGTFQPTGVVRPPISPPVSPPSVRPPSVGPGVVYSAPPPPLGACDDCDKCECAPLPPQGPRPPSGPPGTAAYAPPTGSPPLCGDDCGPIGADGCLHAEMDCAHMDIEKGGAEDAIELQRLPLRILGAVTVAFGIIQLGLGGYAWDLVSHTFSYGPFGATSQAAGAWWAGLSAIAAGGVTIVALDKDWLISSIAISSAATAICLAGAVVDGIVANFHRGVKTCAFWGGNANGFQTSGPSNYALDAGYCYSNIAGYGSPATSLAIKTETSGAIAAAFTAVFGTVRTIFPGPDFWQFVQTFNSGSANSATLPPPDSKNCYCKSADSRTLNFNWVPGGFSTGSPYTSAGSLSNGYNANDNCWQINAGAQYTCSTVVRDGYSIYAASCSFSVFCLLLCAGCAVYSGLVAAWNPPHLSKPNASWGVAGGVNY